MLVLIHGSDTAASRKYFLDIKQKHPELTVLDGEKITSIDLIQIFDSGGLFIDSKTVFIEQLLTKRKKSNELTQITSLIEKNSAEHNIFIWEGKELEKTALNTFKTSDIRIFKLPQNLFLFLDSLKPGNSKALISLFHKTIEVTEVEMVFFMLVRQVRLLLALSSIVIPAKAGIQNTMDPRVKPEDDKLGEIDELKRMAPWQKNKLVNQSKLFGVNKLSELYNKLFELEVAQKTGNLSSPLYTTIDFLLAEI